MSPTPTEQIDLDAMTDAEVCAAEQAEIEQIQAAFHKALSDLSEDEARGLLRGMAGLVLAPHPLMLMGTMEVRQAILNDEIGRLSERPYLKAAIQFLDRLNATISGVAGPLTRQKNEQFLQEITSGLTDALTRGLGLNATDAQETDPACPYCTGEDHSTITPEDYADDQS